MKTGEKIALAGVLVALFTISYWVIKGIMQAEISIENVSIHIKVVYSLIYVLVIIIGISYFLINTKGKIEVKAITKRERKRK